MSWVLLFGGFFIGVVPTMALQVWNGASLLGVIIAAIGGYMVWKEVNDVSG